MQGQKDTPHILLINPWIHDFAAFDFWASPLGLLTLGSMLRGCGYQVSYIDFLDRFHPQMGNGRRYVRAEYGQGPYYKQIIQKPLKLYDVPRNYSRYGLPEELVSQTVKDLQKPDVVMITSHMTYWYPGVFATIDLVRRLLPGVPILLGGIYATLCNEHAIAKGGADHVLSGQNEGAVIELVNKLTGWSGRSTIRFNDLDTYPYPAFDLQHKIPFIPILTGRGCPFSCPYCASATLNPSFLRRSPESVVDEVEYWNEVYGVRDYVFYDDALLINAQSHIVPILEAIVRKGLSLRFHTPNAVHIKPISRTVAQVMARAGFKTLRLGLETAFFGPTRKLDQKVELVEFEQAVSNLIEQGFTTDSVGAYLLYGLPYQDLDALEFSIKRVKELGIKPVLAHYTPIPHTKLWSAALEVSRYDLQSDPIFHNNSIFPCQKNLFSWDQITHLKQLTC